MTAGDVYTVRVWVEDSCMKTGGWLVGDGYGHLLAATFGILSILWRGYVPVSANRDSIRSTVPPARVKISE